jgi:hypothetical protein
MKYLRHGQIWEEKASGVRRQIGLVYLDYANAPIILGHGHDVIVAASQELTFVQRYVLQNEPNRVAIASYLARVDLGLGKSSHFGLANIMHQYNVENSALTLMQQYAETEEIRDNIVHKARLFYEEIKELPYYILKDRYLDAVLKVEGTK